MSKSQEKTLYEKFEEASPMNRRLLRQEELIMEVTEALAEALEELDVTQAELAKRLDKTPGFVSQVLAGGRNLTLRTLADFAGALELDVRFELVRRPAARAANTLKEVIAALATQVQIERALIDFQPCSFSRTWEASCREEDRFDMTSLVIADRAKKSGFGRVV